MLIDGPIIEIHLTKKKNQFRVPETDIELSWPLPPPGSPALHFHDHCDAITTGGAAHGGEHN